MGKEDTQKQIEEHQINLGTSDRARDVLEELKIFEELKEKQKFSPAPKDIFLIITRDESIFSSDLPAGKLIADISSLATELHIIFIGKKQSSFQKINKNTFLYTAKNIPLLDFFTVYKIILSQLVWKHNFIPTIIISIGDEIEIAKRFAKKYHRPLHVFFSYTKLLGVRKISMNALVKACPQKIIIPNEYIEQAIKNNKGYKSEETQIKILPEYLYTSALEHAFDAGYTTLKNNSRNKVFSLITFPHQANINYFLTIKKISKEISSSISKFKIIMVVKNSQFLQAKMWNFLFGLKIIVLKENKDSINLFQTSRMMLYFDSQKEAYEPILYSFISGCPVLSSGDEYSRIILFNSDFQEFSHLERNGKTFGMTIRKLIKDPYVYEKYKINCIGFTKSAFTDDHLTYMTQLKDSLNINNIRTTSNIVH